MSLEVRRIGALLTLVLVLVSGCSSGLQEADLYGVYVATYQNGTETLTLEKNGTFVQEIRLNGSDSAVVNSGTWTFERRGGLGGDLVDLENCLWVGDGFGRIRADFATKRAGCGPPVARRWRFAGELRIRGDEDPAPLLKIK